jgi:D-hydroxyproline dehydrogenase subunit gamma
MHTAPELISVRINGASVQVAQGTSVAAAILNSGCAIFRRSVSGRPRGPLCGMGICFECRVTIDNIAHRRSCQILCCEGMEVRTE